MAVLNPVTVAKAKPLLFSTSMVQAIMRREKTQTRRVVNPQPSIEQEQRIVRLKSGEWYVVRGGALKEAAGGDEHYITSAKPRFTEGDAIYVRETSYYCEIRKAFIYAADGDKLRDRVVTADPSKLKWTPSIYMPRNAARIWLEVTKVRCERLHDVTEEDAKAEGAPLRTHTHVYGLQPTYLGGFATRWDVINAKLWAWSTNPWVWVYDFKVLEAPESK